VNLLCFPGRRHALGCALASVAALAAALVATAHPAQAQTPAAAQTAWPERVVKVIVPYGAGQGADVLARLVSQELARSLNTPFIIDNRAGAGGNIGTAAAAKSAPDGYTLLLGTNATHAANEFLYPNLGYHPVSDFEPVAMIGMLPMVISTSLPDLPANAIAELVARARAKPDTLNVGLPSTTASVVLAQLVRQAQAPLFGVRYKASGQAMTDVIGGQIPLTIDTVIASRPHLHAGKLKALGLTSLKASELLPGIKPVAEQGVPGFDVVAWNAFFAPKGTPPAVVQKLSEHIGRLLQRPELRARLMEIGVEPLYLGTTQLTAFVQEERRKWGETIKAADIRID